MPTPTKNKGAAAVAAANDAALANQPIQKYLHQTTGVKVFHEAGGIVELRALNGGAPACSLHTDLDELMQGAQALSVAGYNCYHTINPISPTLGAPSASDGDIVRIRWIPYDVDPDRKAPDGSKLKGDHASTEAEKSAAFEIAERVTAFWQTLALSRFSSIMGMATAFSCRQRSRRSMRPWSRRSSGFTLNNSTRSAHTSMSESGIPHASSGFRGR